LEDFGSDPKRFILYNRPVIEQAPLQTYCSALVFAPLMSIVRKQFQDCVPRWIRNRPKAQVDWKALVQTIEFGRSHFNTVAFSDELLASGTMGGEIMLWDISSRALLRTIEAHIQECTGVAFLDGVLASVSQDKTIKLWNPTSGTLLKAFEIDISCGVLKGAARICIKQLPCQGLGYQLWGTTADARGSVA
jgi:WD40 repeat protein